MHAQDPAPVYKRGGYTTNVRKEESFSGISYAPFTVANRSAGYRSLSTTPEALRPGRSPPPACGLAAALCPGAEWAGRHFCGWLCNRMRPGVYAQKSFEGQLGPTNRLFATSSGQTRARPKGNVCPVRAWHATFVLCLSSPKFILTSGSPPSRPQRTPWSCITTYRDHGVRFTCVRPSTVAKACIIAYHTHIICQSRHSTVTKIGPVAW